MRHSVT